MRWMNSPVYVVPKSTPTMIVVGSWMEGFMSSPVLVIIRQLEVLLLFEKIKFVKVLVEFWRLLVT